MRWTQTIQGSLASEHSTSTWWANSRQPFPSTLYWPEQVQSCWAHRIGMEGEPSAQERQLITTEKAAESAKPIITTIMLWTQGETPRLCATWTMGASTRRLTSLLPIAFQLWSDTTSLLSSLLIRAPFRSACNTISKCSAESNSLPIRSLLKCKCRQT